MNASSALEAQGYNGYVQIVLRGCSITMNYVDLHDEAVFSECWKVQNGALEKISGTLAQRGRSHR